jgi:MerR family transcriptional regulator, light-induced transcriptional regulator
MTGQRDSMEPTYRIHVAAEMSGLSEGLIRAWERRYGVLKPRRTSSGYRAYTTADIELLRRLKALTENGVAIADAVALVPQLKREVKDSTEARKAPEEEQQQQWRDDVLAAADRLDQRAIEVVLDQAVASLPPLRFFENIVAPLLREVGQRWHAGRITVAEEHVVTHVVRERLLGLLQHAPHRARAHVVCACFPDDEHELGVFGAALRFRHAGWRVTVLGARTAGAHLARVVETVRPQVVALSAIVDPGPEAFEKSLTAFLALVPPQTRVVVGGAAAASNRPVVASSGATLIDTAEAWEALLK